MQSHATAATSAGFIDWNATQITSKGLLISGNTFGISTLLTAINTQAPATKVGASEVCAPESTQQTVTVNLPISDNMLPLDESEATTFKATVDPCPVQLFINGIEGSTPLRIQPKTNGDFVAYIPKESRNHDTTLVRGYRFGVNTFLLKTYDELGHVREQSFALQIGTLDVLPIHKEEIVLPEVHAPLIIAFNNILFNSLREPLEAMLNNLESPYSFSFGGFLESLTPSMMDCIQAAHTPFYVSEYDYTGIGNQYEAETHPEACNTIKSMLDKKEWPKNFLFYTHLNDIKNDLTQNTQTKLFNLS